MSEFSASRWTTACSEWEGGGGRNSERPSELGEGRCKNKAEKGTQTEVGGSMSREKLEFLWRKMPLKPYQVCRRSV